MLLQLRVLRLGLLQDGDVGIGVFPEREEILVLDAGLRQVTLDGIGAAEAKMGEGTDGFVEYDTAMVEDFLELPSGFSTPMRN